MKGFLVSVYRDADGMDCTLNGITSKYSSLYLVASEGFDIPEIFECEEKQALVLKKGIKDYIYAVPYEIFKSGKHSMFGGNFVYTSDSRFPISYPIPVHDRVEN